MTMTEQGPASVEATEVAGTVDPSVTGSVIADAAEVVISHLPEDVEDRVRTEPHSTETPEMTYRIAAVGRVTEFTD